VGARQAFERSIEQHPDQLRAYHNLAFIDAYYNYAADERALTASIRKAAGLLEQGLAYTNWETQPIPEFRCSTLYNLACIHAGLAVLGPGQCVREVGAFL
jgi:hypothetical protein